MRWYDEIPDPDLVMLHITKEHIEEMKAQMPERSEERRVGKECRL